MADLVFHYKTKEVRPPCRNDQQSLAARPVARWTTSWRGPGSFRERYARGPRCRPQPRCYWFLAADATSAAWLRLLDGVEVYTVARTTPRDDLTHWFISSQVTSKEEYLAVVKLMGQDHPIVFGVKDLEDADGSAYPAAIFTSANVLDNARRASEARGGKLLAVTDGKHKTERNGWILIPIGSGVRWWNKKEKKFANKFVPFAYVFTKSERAVVFAYAHERMSWILRQCLDIEYFEFLGLVADASRAIRSGWTSYAPDGVVEMQAAPALEDARWATGVGAATEGPRVRPAPDEPRLGLGAGPGGAATFNVEFDFYGGARPDDRDGEIELLTARLAGKEFNDEGTRWRVLKAGYSDKKDEMCVVIYYHEICIENAVQDDCERSKPHEVLEWIRATATAGEEDDADALSATSTTETPTLLDVDTEPLRAVSPALAARGSPASAFGSGASDAAEVDEEPASPLGEVLTRVMAEEELKDASSSTLEAGSRASLDPAAAADRWFEEEERKIEAEHARRPPSRRSTVSFDESAAICPVEYAEDGVDEILYEIMHKSNVTRGDAASELPSFCVRDSGKYNAIGKRTSSYRFLLDLDADSFRSLVYDDVAKALLEGLNSWDDDARGEYERCACKAFTVLRAIAEDPRAYHDYVMRVKRASDAGGVPLPPPPKRRRVRSDLDASVACGTFLDERGSGGDPADESAAAAGADDARGATFGYFDDRALGPEDRAAVAPTGVTAAAELAPLADARDARDRRVTSVSPRDLEGGPSEEGVTPGLDDGVPPRADGPTVTADVEMADAEKSREDAPGGGTAGDLDDTPAPDGGNTQTLDTNSDPLARFIRCIQPNPKKGQSGRRYQQYMKMTTVRGRAHPYEHRKLSPSNVRFLACARAAYTRQMNTKPPFWLLALSMLPRARNNFDSINQYLCRARYGTAASSIRRAYPRNRAVQSADGPGSWPLANFEAAAETVCGAPRRPPSPGRFPPPRTLSARAIRRPSRRGAAGRHPGQPRHQFAWTEPGGRWRIHGAPAQCVMASRRRVQVDRRDCAF